MALRTTEDAVKDVLLRDYGARPDGTLPDLAPFLASASALTDRLASWASARGLAAPAADLELVERWLAAHCYAMSDQPYASQATGRASGVFQGKTGMYLEASKYGQTAVLLDPTGFLAALGQRRSASAVWLGRPPSEQTPYRLRD